MVNAKEGHVQKGDMKVQIEHIKGSQKENIVQIHQVMGS